MVNVKCEILNYNETNIQMVQSNANLIAFVIIECVYHVGSLLIHTKCIQRHVGCLFVCLYFILQVIFSLLIKVQGLIIYFSKSTKSTKSIQLLTFYYNFINTQMFNILFDFDFITNTLSWVRLFHVDDMNINRIMIRSVQ